jgi:hypothetical protein
VPGFGFAQGNLLGSITAVHRWRDGIAGKGEPGRDEMRRFKMGVTLTGREYS